MQYYNSDCLGLKREGKSRRYEIRNPYPNGGSTSPLYKASVSQIVSIPPEGIPLLVEDYEPVKRVLAVYPDTIIFYNAIVKAMLDNGNRVLLQFDDSAIVFWE